MRETQNKQVPWEHSALRGRFYFNQAAPTAHVAPAQPPRLSDAAEAWDRIKDTTNKGVLEAFIVRYKDTIYAHLARSRIEEQRKQAPLGNKPATLPVIADGHLRADFTERDMARIVALANKKQLPLPSFEMQKPRSDLPASLKRFVGVWVSEYGFLGSGRQFMLIVTSVEAEGTSTGFAVWAPANAKSADPREPPQHLEFKGRISGNALRFPLDIRRSMLVVSWTPQGQLSAVEARPRHGPATVLLAPVWQFSD